MSGKGGYLGGGFGKGLGSKGLGQSLSGKSGAKRHRKVLRDNINGISSGPRLARRGGVKRISAHVYQETRSALRAYVEMVLRDATTYCEYRRAKTITLNDVTSSDWLGALVARRTHSESNPTNLSFHRSFMLFRRHGRPVWGFEHDYQYGKKKASNNS
ncbi:Histone H4 [Apiospora phragmitis]|uniref:Histone H4 n=1 Tax=Apiospora phragmitis TaxID=2905665 RepID=A0ABR1X625_9PEZI